MGQSTWARSSNQGSPQKKMRANLEYTMKTKLSSLSERYLAALRTHLRQGAKANLPSAYGLGRRALAIGLQTLDFAKIHEQALTTLSSADDSLQIKDGMITKAEKFFAEAITPIEETHGAVMVANVSLKQQIAALRQRTDELAAANKQLKKEVAQRKAAEKALKKSEAHHKLLLEQSRTMQEQLRHLSRQILLTQEEERKEISRELHDEIAQTLAGINVHLAALKVEAAANTKGLSKKISSTQRLVERSVKIVHRFALELRPTVLDDLGIIPALHSYMKDFTKRTGIHIQFTAFAGVEQLNSTKRTVLFRVAQAALANVAQHAHASRVKVIIKKLSGTICMKINDDGVSFNVERVILAKRNKRLGLIGMRERVEMVGGTFSIESDPGKGTTVQAQLPFNFRNNTRTRS